MPTEKNIKKEFHENGISITAWSKENNFPVALVYAILNGKRKCLRGKSHEIAVRLGLKKGGDK